MDQHPIDLASAADLIDLAADRHGPHIALIDRDRTFTYDELGRCVASLAAELNRRLGERRDVCCILMDNVFEHVVAIFAALRVGYTLAPVNTSLTPTEIAHQLSDTSATVVLTSPALAGRLATSMQSERCAVRDVVVLRSWAEPPAPVGDGFGAVRVHELVPTELPAGDHRADIDADDEAFIWYTSGTTGRPKGAVHTHRSTVASVGAWADVWDFTPDDRSVLRNLYHVGMVPSVLPYFVSGTSLVMAGPFSLQSVLHDVVHHRVTAWRTFPVVLGLLDKQPQLLQDLDLSAVRRVGVGGPIDPGLLRRSIDRIAWAEWDHSWAQSELNGGGTVAMGRDLLEHMVTIGRPLSCISQLEIHDRDGVSVPRGQTGELCVRGSTVMTHYLNDPVSTADTFRGGWLHTDDLGHIDDDGFVYLVGRQRELIRRGSENVYPAEIELVLRNHPAVADCAAVGIADSVMGEVPVVFVELRPGLGTTPDQLMELARSQLARYKCPVHIEIIDALPRSSIGKVQRFRLVEQAAQHAR